ncbi:uncharacterized protein LOC124920185 isoform X2 [Impatiens glandulifera]|uniref:uncharacterized protein LOC124920185 isoform X2 n=1 Tax=Impatiens glandulifera TaxID=253017 RepID=UPI001FB12CA8|nr:uncharacterized protein LOC124920185 isoform X2 [Impatiens glandulifera]
MEGDIEEYSDSTTLAQYYREERRKLYLKKKNKKKKKKKDEESRQRIEKTNVLGVVVYDVEKGEDHLPVPPFEEPSSYNHGSDEIEVSLFDYSIENHFKSMETISHLCGDKTELDDSNGIELERLSSSIMFLSEWKQFTYHTKTIQFACLSANIPQGKDSVGSVELPQFSASVVPKGKQKESSISSNSSKDFVMYVGGLVWAMDWCPRLPLDSGKKVTCEFISIAAHPPDASYHKIGARLSGRGLIQIWCVVHETFEKKKSLPKKTISYNSNKPRGRPRKSISTDTPPQSTKLIERPIEITGSDNPLQLSLTISTDTPQSTKLIGRSKKITSTDKPLLLKGPIGRPRKITSPDNPLQLKRSRGRPRKIPLKEPINNDCVQDPSKLSLLPDDGVSGEFECLNSSISSDTVCSASTRKRKKLYTIVESDYDSDDDPPLMQNENQQPKLIDVKPHTNEQGHVCSGESIGNGPLQSQSNSGITKDIALPRVVLCLAHNGKVAWDVKWRPVVEDNVKHRLGYLAVLLGNGALEVWDVPHPFTMKSIYSSCQKKGTDPRFLKLDPVFRCSIIKTGDRQSIPLTVEWSSFFPHDLIIAGCHDGVVALWKFSADKSSKDTRPLLCFSADTFPIRTLAWAPSERDPFRPLWDFQPAQRNIYSLDWLSDPRCVIVAFDDGTLRILSLLKAASDAPVTGEPFKGTPQQGISSYYCLPFPIWNVQCSRSSGMVAYCGADGNVLHFQLTDRAVNKDPHRNRAPHFLCGSITEEENQILTVLTPMDDTPFPMKKSSEKWSIFPVSIKGFNKETNKVSREKASETFKNNILAICNKSNSADKLGGEDGPNSERRSKYKPWGGKGKKNGEQTLDTEKEDDDDGGYSNPKKAADDDHDKGGDREEFPSKSVAIHKVRWNMNKGSERWLCYGGAAGIVRLQEVVDL